LITLIATSNIREIDPLFDLSIEMPFASTIRVLVEWTKGYLYRTE